MRSFIEPPSEENVITAIRRLENVGALDKDDNLTPLGHHLAALPVDVRIGKEKILNRKTKVCINIFSL
ncbi:hypothetical protein NQ314_001947 [Rhamnusium bicolor]|uniref:Helicase associated domain-containing protein n=1 Tax=Rhamnusium bicolor TaxID=1586634 RepID=A0AAV8ZQV7_9CUCU|nr:hypothetical protein NQ314_001947 [Rhamnusium bicolor]